MEGSRRARRAPSARVQRRRRVIAVASGAVVVAIVAVTAFVLVPRLVSFASGDVAAGPAPTASATPTPTQTPLTAVQRLLAQTKDPAACAVSFAGDGVTDAPVLESQSTLYQHLPIPSRPGLVFAGWYSTSKDAAAFTTAARVNGADPVTCTDRQITLTAGWKTPAQNTAENAKIPILMYHQFTTDPAGNHGPLRGNFAYIGDFEAQMKYIADGGFYLPTWPELSAFIDGKLFLPRHSVIITDDDADKTWLELAAPIVAKYKVMTTSFVIAVWRSEPSPNEYVLQRSHTFDMHRAGANGRGLMVNASAAEIAADLEKSASILGAKEAMAYPFGHYNDTAKQGVRQAGFDMARTIEPGYVTIGTDKLALPVQRVDYGMGVKGLISEIG